MCIDINECASSPCQHGSSCINRQNGYTCACAPGYEGVHCQIGNAQFKATVYKYYSSTVFTESTRLNILN